MLDIKDKIVNTKVAHELFNKLLDFNVGEETILCKMRDLETDIQKKELLDFINNNDIDWDDIVIKTWEISGFVKSVPFDAFENLDPNKKIYDYDELKLKPEYYN